MPTNNLLKQWKCVQRPPAISHSLIETKFVKKFNVIYNDVIVHLMNRNSLCNLIALLASIWFRVFHVQFDSNLNEFEISLKCADFIIFVRFFVDSGMKW